MNEFRITKRIKNTLQLCFLFIISSLYAQEHTVSGSLLKKSYKTLDSLYYTNEYKEQGKLYINAYLKKAKLEANIKETIRGYHFFADFYDNNYELATVYIDSAITLAIQTNYKDDVRNAAIYGKKGYIERVEGNVREALNYYLKHLELLDPKTNSFNVKYAKYNIGLIKRDYGDLEGAKSILKEHLKLAENDLKENVHDQRGYFEAYLHTLFELVRTYRLNNEINIAKTLNDKGLKIGVNHKLEYLLILNDGILDYYKSDYENSIEKITLTLPKLKDEKNRDYFEIFNVIDAYFYLAQSYKALSNNEQKLLYYKKIDSITEISNYLIPEIKLTYLELVQHYKQQKDSENQLKYLDKFLRVDSILDTNYVYVNNKLETDYDIPNLLKDKESLINSLKNENVETSKKGKLIFAGLIISLFGLSFFYFRQKRYKNKFQALFNETKIETEAKTASVLSTNNTNKQHAIDISEATITHIIMSLQKFEDKENYLKTNLTLDKLAKRFQTNTKYLSFVLNNIKEKSVSQYLNDLRIAYVVKKLKQDSKFRKFTIKAIANDIGFNTDQSFSKAFYKKTGIYPSYFIKELEKTKK